MKSVCDVNMCNGCMACISVCPKHCIKVTDSINALNAKINESLCINCKLCRKICPNISKAVMNKPIEWKQGWAASEVRDYSTSGGAASAIMYGFIQSGGYVAACLFNKGKFVFDISNDKRDIKKFAGSKYVKSNPIDIYEKIIARLKTDKVLFVGLPCQVAAIKNYVKEHENLYTIDLICHGTPSINLLIQYLNEAGYKIENIDDIKFRTKVNFGLSVNGERITSSRGIDEYLCAFLEGIDYTENCYSCQFAALDRVSDVTLGDSWGTEYKEQEKEGISLILIQSKKGKEIVEMARMDLKEVDLENAIANNRQLSYPTVLSSKRKKFFCLIEKGTSFKTSTFKVIPKLIIKQRIKGILSLIHLIDRI